MDKKEEVRLAKLTSPDMKLSDMVINTYRKVTVTPNESKIKKIFENESIIFQNENSSLEYCPKRKFVTRIFSKS